jgi:hypothetical protein
MAANANKSAYRAVASLAANIARAVAENASATGANAANRPHRCLNSAGAIGVPAAADNHAASKCSPSINSRERCAGTIGKSWTPIAAGAAT